MANLHSSYKVGNGFCDGVIACHWVALTSLIEQLDKLGREPAPQAIQLANPTMLIFLGDYLQLKDKSWFKWKLNLNISFWKDCPIYDWNNTNMQSLSVCEA